MVRTIGNRVCLGAKPPVSNRHQPVKDGKEISVEAGQVVADFDLLIAGTALTFSTIPVTNNVRDCRIGKGLRRENWTEG